MSWRDAPAAMAHWLLARHGPSHPDEIACSFVFGPVASSLERVVRGGRRPLAVEHAFELAKQEVGLDECEMRHWTGRYRHVTVAMVAPPSPSPRPTQPHRTPPVAPASAAVALNATLSCQTALLRSSPAGCGPSLRPSMPPQGDGGRAAVFSHLGYRWAKHCRAPDDSGPFDCLILSALRAGLRASAQADVVAGRPPGAVSTARSAPIAHN